MTNLNEMQKSIEVRVFARADSAKKYQRRMQKDSGQEYNLNYGQDALLEMIPVVERFISEMYTKRNQHTKKFFWNIVKPLKEAGNTPEKTIAEMVAVTLAGTISREVTLTNTASKMTMSAFHIFNVDHDARDESHQHGIQFFGQIIQLIAEETDIFTVEQVDGREYRLFTSPQWHDHIIKAEQDCKTPISGYEPMVVVPTPHKSLLDDDSGYLISKSPLMKKPFKVKGRVHKNIRDFTAKKHPEYFDYINKVQSTPYCVNTPLMEVIKRYYGEGFFFSDFPVDIQEDEVEFAANKEITKRNKARRDYATRNDTVFAPLTDATVRKVFKSYTNKEGEKVRKTLALLEQAEYYAGFDSMYYPIFLDSRGRMYPYASGCLSYQGDEMAKALIQFSNKKTLDVNGIAALFETLANTLKLDKQDRDIKADKAYKWFNTMKEAFMADDWSVFFTHQDMFDEPINAMAICIELVALEKDPNHMCGYIAHRDARVSGSSIIGTAMRDKGIMEMTSIIDWVEDGKLGDAYVAAAEASLKLCGELADQGNALAKDLMKYSSELFTRSVFKHVVMTWCSYGLSDFSLREYNKGVFDWNEVLSKSHKIMFDQVMLDALELAVPSCSAYLKVFREAGKQVAAREGVVSFANPYSKFPVMFSAKKTDVRQIEIRQPFKIIKLKITTPTNKIDTRGITLAMSPNTTHSIDASLLYLVGYQCEHGLCFIHDSVGSHPNDAHLTVTAYAHAMNHVAKTDPFNNILEQLNVEERLELVNTATDEDVESIKTSKHALV